MQENAGKFFNLELGKGDLKGAMYGKAGTVTGAEFPASDFTMKDIDMVCKWGGEKLQFSSALNPN